MAERRQSVEYSEHHHRIRGTMKEQTKKVTRHQTRISSLAWHDEGKVFASGDESGTVLVWDTRQKAPLDVGEMIQRRKKMQHEGKVTVWSLSP